jgi:hypothetical protein
MSLRDTSPVSHASSVGTMWSGMPSRQSSGITADESVTTQTLM